MKTGTFHSDCKLIFLVEEFLELDHRIKNRKQGYVNLISCYENAIEEMEKQSSLIASGIIEGRFPQKVQEAFLMLLNEREEWG